MDEEPFDLYNFDPNNEGTVDHPDVTDPREEDYEPETS